MKTLCDACSGAGEILQDDGSDSVGTLIPCEICAIDAGKPGMTIQKFENVSCSSCGEDFGPGNHGFSHCESHKGMQPIN